MEQKFYSYPHFVANQVLKSKDLNDSFGYLDEQARMARARFLGCGILEGLTFSYKDSTLTINPGTALNRRGWMFQLQEKTQYKYAANISSNVSLPFNSDTLDELLTVGEKVTAPFYVCFKTKDEALELGFTPVALKSLDVKHKTLALAIGTRSRTRVCSGSSCDINLGDRKVEMLPLLIDNSYIGMNLVAYPVKPVIANSRPNRAAIDFRYANYDAIMHQLKSNFNSARDEAMKSFFQVWTDALCQKKDIKYNTRILNGPLGLVSSEANPILARLKNAYFRINSLKAGAATKFIPDYYLFFIEDIHSALNEFLEEYCRFADKYGFIPNKAYSDNSLVYLGSLDESLGDSFRSMFFNPNDEGFRRDMSRLLAFLERVAAMSECFIGSSMNEGFKNPRHITILSETPFSKISERPVPPYYVQKESFMGLWHLDDKFSDRRNADYPSELVKDTRDSAYDNLDKDRIYYCMKSADEAVYLAGYEGRHMTDKKLGLYKPRTREFVSLDWVEIYIPNVKMTKEQCVFLRDAFFTEKVYNMLNKGGYLNPIINKLSKLGKNEASNVQRLQTGFSSLLKHYKRLQEMMNTLIAGDIPTLSILAAINGQLTNLNKISDDDVKEYVKDTTAYLSRYVSIIPRGWANDFKQKLASALCAFVKLSKVFTKDDFFKGFSIGGILAEGGQVIQLCVQLQKGGVKGVTYLTKFAPER